MTGKHGGKIYRTGTLGAVESPHSLRPIRIHIHSLGTVTPAWSHADGSAYALAFKFLGTGRCLGHAPDGTVGDNALYRRTVTISYIFTYQFRHSVSQIHSLFFETFAHTPLARINNRSNTDLGILGHR